MDPLFLAVITGVVVSGVTELAKKLNLPPLWVVLGLSLIAGIGYQCFTYLDVKLRTEVITFALGAYGTSQLFYRYIYKMLQNRLAK